MSADKVKLRIPNYPLAEEWKKSDAELDEKIKETSGLNTEHDGNLKEEEETDFELDESFLYEPSGEGSNDGFPLSSKEFENRSNENKQKNQQARREELEDSIEAAKALAQHTEKGNLNEKEKEKRLIFEMGIKNKGGKRKRTKKARRSKKRKTTKKKRRSKKRKTTKKK